MPTPLPSSVRERWGEEVADDFSRWLEAYVQEHAVARDEYREILSRLDVLENEVSGVNDRLDRMEERFETRFNQMDERIDRMHEQMRVMMRWTVGTIALFGTIVTGLVAIAEFAP
jgi:flagellar capping protein FliD